MTDAPPTIRWSCLEEKVFLDFPYLQIVERLCRNENAGAGASGPSVPHRFYVIRARDWCNVIPFTEEGKIVLIRQFRAGTLDTPYEFAGGVIESSDEDLEHCALRELLEETGYSPVPGAKVRALGSAHPNPALQDNQVHSFAVGPVRKTRAQSLDESEDVVVEEKTVAEFLELFCAGKFTHALMLTSLFFLVQSILGKDGLATALERGLEA